MRPVESIAVGDFNFDGYLTFCKLHQFERFLMNGQGHNASILNGERIASTLPWGPQATISRECVERLETTGP